MRPMPHTLKLPANQLAKMGCHDQKDHGVAVPLDRRVTLAGVALGLRRLAWLIEVRGLANRSEVFRGLDPVKKVRDLGRPGGPRACR